MAFAGGIVDDNMKYDGASPGPWICRYNNGTSFRNGDAAGAWLGSDDGHYVTRGGARFFGGYVGGLGSQRWAKYSFTANSAITSQDFALLVTVVRKDSETRYARTSVTFSVQVDGAITAVYTTPDTYGNVASGSSVPYASNTGYLISSGTLPAMGQLQKA